jgi:acetyltransferase-like isoleucine patch superfamily enzyme
MRFGADLCLRSSVRSNPLGPNHPVILVTWQAGAVLEIGDNFGMTGGVICAAERIAIGDRVTIGANVTILDTDFHPLNSEQRNLTPAGGQVAPVTIGDDAFIGTNSLILKRVTIGQGSIVGAGSVVTKNVPPSVIVAGNPATIVREL